MLPVCDALGMLKYNRPYAVVVCIVETKTNCHGFRSDLGIFIV